MTKLSSIAWKCCQSATKSFAAVILALCMGTLSACGILGSTSDTPSTGESPVEVSLKEAFSASCPLQATGFFNDETIQIEFTNKSNETITAWTGAVAFYDKNDKVIKGSQGNILWGIKGTDVLAANRTSTWQYSIIAENPAQVRLYLYYVCFDNQTAWGREDLSEAQAITYGENFSIQRDLSEYYSGDCCMVDSEGYNEKSQIVTGYGLILNLTNASDQPIIAYEAIIVQYDVYGNKLKGSSDTSFYKAIQCAPVDFEPDSSDFRRYSYYESTSYAEVYLYYVLFEDRTSWGYREYMNPVQAMKYGKKFVLERT